MTDIRNKRFGLNITAGQIKEPLTQEAFRDQDRVNYEIRNKFIDLENRLISLMGESVKAAEAVEILASINTSGSSDQQARAKTMSKDALVKIRGLNG